MVAGMAEAGQPHDEPLHEEDRRTPSPGQPHDEPLHEEDRRTPSLGHYGRDLT
jgi:hypothetical protein